MPHLIAHAAAEAVAAVPAGPVLAADLFQTGSSLANKALTTLLAAAAAAIAWGLAKALFRNATVLSAILALLTAVGLFWLLSNVRNPSLQKPFDDTISENFGAPPPVHLDPDRKSVLQIGPPGGSA